MKSYLIALILVVCLSLGAARVAGPIAPGQSVASTPAGILFSGCSGSTCG